MLSSSEILNCHVPCHKPYLFSMREIVEIMYCRLACWTFCCVGFGNVGLKAEQLRALIVASSTKLHYYGLLQVFYLDGGLTDALVTLPMANSKFPDVFQPRKTKERDIWCPILPEIICRIANYTYNHKIRNGTN